jgi:hypothetical protein
MLLPEFQPDKLTLALEQAIYSAHTHRNTNLGLTILILHDWKHTPYLARNVHTTCVQQIATNPRTHANQQQNQPKYKLHIYIVANSKALSQLDASNIYNALNTSLTQEYRHITQTTKIGTTLLNATTIDCSKSYTNTPTPTLLHSNTTILQTKSYK